MRDKWVEDFVKKWRVEVASRKKAGTMHYIDEEIRRLKAGEVWKNWEINTEKGVKKE